MCVSFDTDCIWVAVNNFLLISFQLLPEISRYILYMIDPRFMIFLACVLVLMSLQDDLCGI